MRSIIVLILIFFSCLPYAVFSQEFGSPLIRNYSPKEYGYDPSVFSILQDQYTDILYFGVNDIGILAYDGVRWKEIATPNRIVAYSLAQSANGTIYAGTVDDFGYLAREKQGKMVYQSLIGLISDTTVKIGTVWSIKTTDQAVYFQTYDHIFEYLPATQKLHWIKSNPEGRFLGDFVYQNQYYIKISNRGLFKIENQALVAVPQSEFFKNKNDFREALAYDSQTFLIPMRTEGLFLYDIKENNPPRPFLLENKDFLLENNIYTSYAYPPHGFAFGQKRQNFAGI